MVFILESFCHGAFILRGLYPTFTYTTYTVMIYIYSIYRMKMLALLTVMKHVIIDVRGRSMIQILVKSLIVKLVSELIVVCLALDTLFVDIG